MSKAATHPPLICMENIPVFTVFPTVYSDSSVYSDFSVYSVSSVYSDSSVPSDFRRQAANRSAGGK